jgi:hypothetical protein
MNRITALLLFLGFLLVAAGCNKEKPEAQPSVQAPPEAPTPSGVELKELVSTEGKFKVQMPGTPKKSTDAKRDMTTFMVDEGGKVYGVSFSDLKIPANEPDEMVQKRLDGSRDGYVRNTKSKLKLETKIMLEGKYPGRALDAENTNLKVILRARFWLVKQRLYMVQVIGPESWINSPAPTQFLDSFALTE